MLEDTNSLGAAHMLQYVYHLLVMNHLTGVQMGIFTNENDVILFFKRSQHLCLEMFVRKNKSYFRGGHMNSCTKVYFKIPCRY